MSSTKVSYIVFEQVEEGHACSELVSLREDLVELLDHSVESLVFGLLQKLSGEFCELFLIHHLRAASVAEALA